MEVPVNYYSRLLKQEFLKYEEVRKLGKYNMIMDMNKVIAEYGIGFKDYIYIINNYSKLAKKYL